SQRCQEVLLKVRRYCSRSDAVMASFQLPVHPRLGRKLVRTYVLRLPSKRTRTRKRLTLRKRLGQVSRPRKPRMPLIAAKMFLKSSPKTKAQRNPSSEGRRWRGALFIACDTCRHRPLSLNCSAHDTHGDCDQVCH